MESIGILSSSRVLGLGARLQARRKQRPTTRHTDVEHYHSDKNYLRRTTFVQISFTLSFSFFDKSTGSHISRRKAQNLSLHHLRTVAHIPDVHNSCDIFLQISAGLCLPTSPYSRMTWSLPMSTKDGWPNVGFPPCSPSEEPWSLLTGMYTPYVSMSHHRTNRVYGRKGPGLLFAHWLQIQVFESGISGGCLRFAIEGKHHQEVVPS